MKKALLIFALAACDKPLDSDIPIACASTPIIETTQNLCEEYRELTLIALGGLHKVDGITHAETSDFLEIDCAMQQEEIANTIETELDLSTAELCVIRPPS